MCRSLQDLDLVHRLWGSSGTLAAHIAARMRETRASKTVILDVGAGAGDVGRRLARRLTREGVEARIVLLDLQWRHLAAGRRRVGKSGFSAIAGDAFALPLAAGAVDWAVSTLVFHHFTPEENVAFLRELSRVARRGFAVLDIRRHVLPLLFVAVAGRFLFRSPVSVLDGMASVRQAYTQAEAREVAARAVPTARVERVFPYALLLSGAGS